MTLHVYRWCRSRAGQFNSRTMRSLYAKFVLLGILFTCLTMGVQFMWWKHGYVYMYKKSEVDGEDYVIKSNSLSSVLVKNTPCVNRTSLDDCNGAESTVTANRMDRGPLFIWDTSSSQDRIPEQMRHIPVNIRTGDRRPRIIIVDGGPYQWNVKYGSATFEDHECPVRNCHLVDKSTKAKRVDAVLFGQSLTYLSYQSKIRHVDQVWIFYALESPMVTGKYHEAKNVFNWTATYRRDSTIVAPYERWLPFDNATLIKRTKNYAKGKSKMAAMFVSNCLTQNNRLEYAKELSQYVNVDIYGFCGDKECPRSQEKKCSKLLNKDYKFYLAFENANCRDYITEKFFVNGLGHDVIPVVMGGHPDDYAKSAPPHSYIHVEDFKSPKELAAYMKHLDKNDDFYNEYFNWKGTGTFLNTKFWCRLCALVSDDNKPNLIVNDLNEWWGSKDTCQKGRWTQPEM